MRLLLISWLPLLLLTNQTTARRVRIHPTDPSPSPTVQYYAAEPQDDPPSPSPRHLVLVSSADHYNGLYGQPTASSRLSPDPYLPSPRKPLPLPPAPPSRQKEQQTKAPPVQTIRNYNKVNDDGSFTFGYEAADGSFKEETRGTDCVVRGKYGYVDPDGNKREFTYVSGNPCDPNALKEEEAEEERARVEEERSAEEEAAVANYPRARARLPKPAVALFQHSYEEEEQVEPEQLVRPAARAPPRPQYAPQVATPAPYRPPQPPATTYRPQLVQVTPRPSLAYKQQATVAPARGVDFDAEFQKFQQENNIIGTTPAGVQAKANPIYSSALVFDPSSGQYNTQLYQTLPQNEGDFRLSQRIQPYVHQPQYQRAPQAYARPEVGQARYQQQQAGAQFQNSAQLYAQQQRARLAQQAQQRPVYYVQPQHEGAGGQIDAFLRGHNIQF